MLQTTIKTVNYTHLMPTRYTLDVDLRTLFTNDILKERKLQKETSQVRHRQDLPPCCTSVVWRRSQWLGMCRRRTSSSRRSSSRARTSGSSPSSGSEQQAAVCGRWADLLVSPVQSSNWAWGHVE